MPIIKTIRLASLAFLILSASACTKETNEMSDTAVPDAGAVRVSGQFDTGVGRDSGQFDTGVGRDSEPPADSGCEPDQGYFFEQATRIPLETFCKHWEGCPEDLDAALAALRKYPVHTTRGFCPYLLINGCGVDTVIENWGTHATAYHYDSKTGLVAGGEYMQDIPFELAGCSANDFVAGVVRPKCSSTVTKEFCGTDVDGGA